MEVSGASVAEGRRRGGKQVRKVEEQRRQKARSLASHDAPGDGDGMQAEEGSKVSKQERPFQGTSGVMKGSDANQLRTRATNADDKD